MSPRAGGADRPRARHPARRATRRVWVWVALAIASPWGALGAREVEPFFAVASLRFPGRTVAAEIADVNGDGRADLLHVDYEGLPPVESRVVRVHLQRADGAFAAEPDRTWPLPSGSAAYDIADVDGRAGRELVLLVRDGLAILSPQTGAVRMLRVPGAPTAAVAADERGLDPLPLLRTAPTGERWWIVPLLGQAALLTPAGQPRGLLEVGQRANYFLLGAEGPPIGEADIQLFVDTPHIELGDVDGDGRSDVLAATRHALRVFLQRPDGQLPNAPDRVLPLHRISELDHVRGAGTVALTSGDLDGDGRVDLVITSMSGGITSSHTRLTVHQNRGGSWNLDVPDQVLEVSGGLSFNELQDLDGDGRPELVQVLVHMSVLEMVEFFLQRAYDVEITVSAVGSDGAFQTKRAARLAFDVPWNLESFRPRGFLPLLELDLNADGRLDLLRSGGGTSLEVHLAGSDGRLSRRPLRQALDTRGRLRAGDLEGDGLPDLVLYDPTDPEASVRVLRNCGRLPGTPPSAEASPGSLDPGDSNRLLRSVACSPPPSS
ncbi:MAG: FG-GAP repeat domain-containing protein [Myxococcota bacterium]